MEGKKFGLRVSGREHGCGDANRPGCESIETERYPRPHRDFGGSCLGLVHAERLVNETNKAKTVLVCDTCFANPRWPLSE
jgi:hypothetical protein